MRKISLLIAAACAFGAAPYVNALGHVGGSLALLGLALVLAFCASGGIFALAAAFGAGGAFASVVLGSVSPAAAGAALVGLAFAERTMRVRGGTARLVHVGAALVGGALAGSLSNAYAFSSPAVRIVAVLVAGVLVALPLLVDADDPVAYTLEGTASLVPEPAKKALLDGADLRRNVRDVPLDTETTRHVRKTWSALLKLAEARVRLERTRAVRAGADPSTSPAAAVVAMVDAKIADHVTALSRAYTAADTVRAAELGLDDIALKNVETAGENLDEVSRAIVDVKV
jgi:hypothetical protein